MDYIGTDFNSTGSVIPKSELTAARLKRGECATCGRKCYKKKLFKMIPIDDQEGKILNGRCLHCNPLHSSSSNHTKTSKNPSGHSYNRNSSGHSHNSNGRQLLQRSIHGSPVIDAPVRALSIPPHPHSTTTSHHHKGVAAKTDTNNSNGTERSTRTTLVPLSSHERVDQSTRTSVSAMTCSKSLHSETLDTGIDGKPRAHDQSSHSRSYRDSLHSIAFSSASSVDSASCGTISSHHSNHRGRPPSPQISMGSNSTASALTSSHPSKEGATSQDELKKAALVLLTAAQEHGLTQAGDALATSLQDIVNVAKSSGRSSDTPHATTTTTTSTSDDDEKMESFVVALEDDSHPRNDEKSGVLDRGGAFPMRCGRLIYTGSTRTLSSMSSIDEGDRNHPTSHIQFQRGVGKSSRTLGSLSTIDGTNEDDFNSQSDHDKLISSSSSISKSSNDKKVDPGHTIDYIPVGFSSEAKTGESLVSGSLSEESNTTQEKVYSVRQEETKGRDTEIESVMQRLRDSIDSSSPDRSMEAMESLSEFLALFSDDPEPHLDLYIERDLAGVLVAVMTSYLESPEIQAKACNILTTLVVQDSYDHRKSPSTRLRRPQIIVNEEGAGEAILFSSMILHEDNPKVQEAALNTMRCLCKDCQENQISFWKLDAIEPILRAMEHHPRAPRVQEIAASVLSMLVENPKNENAKTAIGENGGVPLILQAMSIHLEDLRVVESSMHALYTLILECPHNVLIVLKSPGATQALLDAMRSHANSLALQEIGCAMLVKLTTLSQHTDMLLDNGGSTGIGMAKSDDSMESKPNDLLERLIETILEAIQTHSSVPIIQDFGFAVLANLTDSNETKMFIVDLGVLDAIVLAMVLHKDNVGVQERICCLLLLLAVQENHQHILAANPIELVKIAAHKYPEECLEPASRLIRQLGHEL